MTPTKGPTQPFVEEFVRQARTIEAAAGIAGDRRDHLHRMLETYFGLDRADVQRALTDELRGANHELDAAIARLAESIEEHVQGAIAMAMRSAFGATAPITSTPEAQDDALNAAPHARPLGAAAARRDANGPSQVRLLRRFPKPK